jgi:pteridine reductase
MAESMNKVVLITGAAQRIGEQLARTLHQRGYRVLIHYRSNARAEAISAELNRMRPDSAHAIAADFAEHAQVPALAQQAMAKWGRLDALINNASSYFPTRWGETDEQAWDTLFSGNLKGPFFLTQALLPALTRQRGCIINLLDIAIDRPAPGFGVYCMAKAGLAMMTRSLALELRGAARVNGIAPGVILWPEQPLAESAKQETLARIPLGETGSPSDIVRTALFLLEEAPYINGQIIAVDGGLNLQS